MGRSKGEGEVVLKGWGLTRETCWPPFYCRVTNACFRVLRWVEIAWATIHFPHHSQHCNRSSPHRAASQNYNNTWPLTFTFKQKDPPCCTDLWPSSCATVYARESPVSSLMLQDRWGWHNPFTCDSPRVLQGRFIFAQILRLKKRIKLYLFTKVIDILNVYSLEILCNTMWKRV